MTTNESLFIDGGWGRFDPRRDHSRSARTGQAIGSTVSAAAVLRFAPAGGQGDAERRDQDRSDDLKIANINVHAGKDADGRPLVLREPPIAPSGRQHLNLRPLDPQ